MLATAKDEARMDMGCHDRGIAEELGKLRAVVHAAAEGAQTDWDWKLTVEHRLGVIEERINAIRDQVDRTNRLILGLLTGVGAWVTVEVLKLVAGRV